MHLFQTAAYGKAHSALKNSLFFFVSKNLKLCSPSNQFNFITKHKSTIPYELDIYGKKKKKNTLNKMVREYFIGSKVPSLCSLAIHCSVEHILFVLTTTERQREKRSHSHRDLFIVQLVSKCMPKNLHRYAQCAHVHAHTPMIRWSQQVVGSLELCDCGHDSILSVCLTLTEWSIGRFHDGTIANANQIQQQHRQH